MALTLEPEIRRCDLTAVLLELKCLDFEINEFDFMDRPDEEAGQYIEINFLRHTPSDNTTVHSGLTTLSILGAIDKHQNLTDVGRKMAILPLDPKFSRSILASGELGCSREVVDLVSVLSTPSRLFLDIPNDDTNRVGPQEKFKHPSGDHFTTLNAFRAYQEMVSSGTNGEAKGWCARNFLNERTLSEAMEIRSQLRGICKRIGVDADLSCGGQVQPILHCLVLGLIQNTAFIQPNGFYKQVMGPSVCLAFGWAG